MTSEHPHHHTELEKSGVDTEDGSVEFGCVHPEDAPTGKPVMVLPGYGEQIETMTPVSQCIAQNPNGVGTHDVYIVSHARWNFAFSPKKIRELYPDAPPEALALGVPILRRAHEAIVVLDQRGARAHLVGHSLGGMTAVAIALLRPDLVESLVLSNSAGVTAKVPWTRIFGRMLSEWVQQVQRYGTKMVGVISNTFFKYMLPNLIRAHRENKAATTDMTPLLMLLAKRGVKITIVHDALDRVFPSKEVEEQLRLVGGENPPFKVKRTEGHMHYGPVTNPHEYGEIVAGIIDESERA